MGLPNLRGDLADLRGALPPQPPPPVATGLICIYYWICIDNIFLEDIMNHTP